MGIMYSVQEDNLTTDFGISPLFPTTIEDNTKVFKGTAVIAGQCLENTTEGLVIANASSTVYGLAKESVNVEANVNEVSDNGWGIFGSKKITACMFGVYSVKNFEYTKGDGDVVEFTAIDTNAINANTTLGVALASDANGNITTAESDGFGTLLAVSADGKEIQVFIK